MASFLKYFASIIIFYGLSISCNKSSGFSYVEIAGIKFRAYVDGAYYYPDRFDVSFPPVRVIFMGNLLTNTRDLYVAADKDHSSINLWIPSPVVTGRIELNQDTYPWPIAVHPPQYGSFYINYPQTYYVTNQIHTGFVDIIKVDTINHKVEARFEFTGVDRYTGETVRVSRGFISNY